MKNIAINLVLVIYLLVVSSITAYPQSGWKSSDLPTTETLNSISYADSARGMIVGNNGVIFKTSDGGNSWTKLNIQTTGNLYKVQYLDSLHAFIGNNSSIYKTIDGGATWENIKITVFGITTFSFIDADTGWAFSMWNFIHKTTDGGVTWSSDTISDGYRSSHFINSNTGFYSDMYGKVVKTNDGGVTWESKLPGSISGYVTLDFSFYKNEGLAVGGGEIYRTIDTGETWSRHKYFTTTLTNFTSVVHLNDKLCLAAESNGQILVSSDGGVNWGVQDTLATGIMDLIRYDDSTVFAVGANGKLYKYEKPSDKTVWATDVWKDGTPDGAMVGVILSNYNSSQNGAIKAKGLIVADTAILVIDKGENVHIDGEIINNGKIIVKDGVLTFNKLTGNKIDQEIVFNTIPPLRQSSSVALTPKSGSGLPVELSISNEDAAIEDTILTGIYVGSAIVTAVQSGNEFYNAAQPVMQTVEIVNPNESLQLLSVSNWFENKKSATVITYDDFSPGHPAYGFPDLINRNMAGTFFVTTTHVWRQTDYPDMISAVDKGIEIANHTNLHPQLSTLTPAKLNEEVNGALNFINTNVTNQRCNTFAYPFGDFNNDVLEEVKKNHIGARTVFAPTNGWPYDFAKQENDYFTIPTKTINSSVSIEDIQLTVEEGINEGGLVTFMIHSINGPTVNDQWFDVISSTFHAQVLDSINVYKEQTWITTFRNAIKYHKEANSSAIVVSYNDKYKTEIVLSDTLSDNELYNFPLTVNYITYHNYFTDVKQNGKKLPFVQGNGMITFNAIPDGGLITLIKDTTLSKEIVTLTKSVHENAALKVYPVPAMENLNIQLEGGINELLLSDMLGNTIKHFSFNTATFTSINISDIPQGIYLVKVVSSDRRNYYQKIVKR